MQCKGGTASVMSFGLARFQDVICKLKIVLT